jgi:hypothetical protein
MHARRFLTGLATASVALAGLALTAGPANAAITTDPDDIAWTSTGTWLIGTGSDTTQHVMKLTGDAFNATNPAAKISTYAATNGGATCTNASDCQITLPAPDGVQNRPFGSGAGRGFLFGTNNKSTVTYARTSATMDAPAQQAGLQQFPFALDYVTAAVSGNVTSNAPSTLSVQDLIKIYTCQTVNPGPSGTVVAPQWNEVGGTSTDRVAPVGPSASSGTGTTFYAALTAANGGVTVTPGGCVKSANENDATPVKDNANAIAPFSEGLANLATAAGNKVVTLPNAVRAQRALYNVVRGTDVSNPNVTAMFGSKGFLCSPAAKSLIEQSGFKQLRAPDQGGVCGLPTQSATTNFAADAISTSTTVTVTSASATAAKVVAKVTASSAPNGQVTFYEGTTQVGSAPLASGQATIQPAAAPGTHTYRAVYTPIANSAFIGSEGTGSGSVQKATSTVSGKFGKATLKAGKAKSKGTVDVALNGASVKASGAVTVSYKGKVVGKGTLSNGTAKVTVKLKKLKKAGSYKLALAWAGDTNGDAAAGTAKVKVVAPKKKTTKK